MRKRNGLFWIGLLVYAISFLMTAVAGFGITSGPARGYHCAFWAFVLPFQALGGASFAHTPTEFISLVICGWINPTFLVTIALVLRGRPHRSIVILRFIIVLMIPFCWIVFYYENLYPREGWFLWIAGMLLVLFSSIPKEFASRLRSVKQPAHT